MPGAPIAAATRGLALLRRGQCCWVLPSRWRGGAIHRPRRTWSWYRLRRCRDSRTRFISNTELSPIAVVPGLRGDYRVSLAERENCFHNENSCEPHTYEHEGSDHATQQQRRCARLQLYGAGGSTRVRGAHGGRASGVDEAGGGARQSLSFAAARGNRGATWSKVVFPLGRGRRIVRSTSRV